MSLRTDEAGDRLSVIDLRDHTTGTSAERRRVLERVDDGCARHGFFLVRGHGVDPALLDGIRSASAAFFDAPIEYKEKYHFSGTHRGYTPIGTERLGATARNGQDAPFDLKEAFAVGNVDLPERVPGADELDGRPIDWPDRPADFKSAWLAYRRAARALADRLVALLADALGVDRRHFASRLDRSVDFLRVINYPQQSGSAGSHGIRAGAHTDFGALTILAIDDAPGGLQVRARDGGWIDVPYVHGTFVVNIGDLMAHWTNHRWVSAVHRVVNPPVDATGPNRRQSVVFFHNPNLDAVIRPLAACVAPGEAPPPPVTAGEWLRSQALRQRVMPADRGG
jgi:isopenicillin N synthase-like dioxygenase